jgi:hypothetical protein
MLLIHRERAFSQVTMRVVDVANAAVADVFEERWFVQQPDQKRCIAELEPPQQQPARRELRNGAVDALIQLRPPSMRLHMFSRSGPLRPRFPSWASALKKSPAEAGLWCAETGVFVPQLGL